LNLNSNDINPSFDVSAGFTMKIQNVDDSDEVLSAPTPLALGTLCVSLIEIEGKYGLDLKMCGPRGLNVWGNCIAHG